MNVVQFDEARVAVVTNVVGEVFKLLKDSEYRPAYLWYD